MNQSLRQGLIVYSHLTEIPSAIAILGLLWMGLKRSDVAPKLRVKTWASIAAVLTVWYVAYSMFAAHGGFQATMSRRVPAIPFGVFGPLLLGLVVARWSEAIRKAILALPLSWLIAVQFYRVIGYIFIFLAQRGDLPGVFGYPAGVGDVLVGVLEIPTAWAVSKHARGSRFSAYAWNYLGVLDFMTAIFTVFLSSPSPIQRPAIREGVTPGCRMLWSIGRV